MVWVVYEEGRRVRGGLERIGEEDVEDERLDVMGWNMGLGNLGVLDGEMWKKGGM